MDIENLHGFTLRGVGHINVILGKNGCGKSYLLKNVEQPLAAREEVGEVRYISPERGGVLSFDSGVEQQITQSPQWLSSQRRKNRSENFRQQSVSLFRRLELLTLREIERDHVQPDYIPRNFNQTLKKLNMLLDRVALARDDKQVFSIHERNSGKLADPGNISSGESESISLGIEILAFTKEIKDDKNNFLLVDEPDVHLHPDLQYRLARFCVDVLNNAPITLIIATHSTALLGALSNITDINVAFMKIGDQNLRFEQVTDIYRAILPVFGAHPLSNVFNKAPILLVEGQDDERIWQQAVRSSEGQIRVYPCVVGNIDRFADYETEVNKIIGAVYDHAQAYSLRDRDTHTEAIDDMRYVIRMRLNCRASENLMLSDDVLSLTGTVWPDFEPVIQKWIESNDDHQYHKQMLNFAKSGFNRKEHDIKNIRNILVSLMSTKPWEVLVGQAIGQLSKGQSIDSDESLKAYLGKKICSKLLNIG